MMRNFPHRKGKYVYMLTENGTQYDLNYLQQDMMP